ncbi:MAG: hypothetical protein QOJ63_2253 [Solirubrobacteraceae bacterium]|nr:hypothetical protein [Solirubrobacteraceae bacterium]
MVSFPTAGATIAPRAIGLFRDRFPGVEVTLAPREPDEGLECLKAGECDFALTVEAGFDPIADKAIERHHLLDDPMYVGVPAHHPAATKRRLKLKDLADEAWIMGVTRTCPDGQILQRACQGAGFEPRLAFQSDDYVAIQGFVAAGVGVCFIPDLALVAVRDDVVIRRLEGLARSATSSPPRSPTASSRPPPPRCSTSSWQSAPSSRQRTAHWRWRAEART